ncbi:MAG: type 2 isopentenyl-diphosphate Delta-isomerase [Sandaracinaceae bacterium]|nr:type 2 isopentenyl-diphosphate Delta-isomerase [Sandaracinaceae bacterium]MDW8246706.1 type 2 isopentenyl-diphosphate Delta-isomerase [Sandaracinaceae bacterium]
MSDTLQNPSPLPTASRKDEHLALVLRENVAFSGLSLGFGRFALEYDALPEINLDEVDPSIQLFGKRLRAPILIGAMTGGTPFAGRINQTLARVASRLGLGLALGSQRVMVEDPSLTWTYDVRGEHPELPLLFGNIGAVQLNRGISIDRVFEALEHLHIDALNVHLNPLQEAIQPEGDTCFANLLPKLKELVNASPVPVIIKECGAGLSRRTLSKLVALPIAGVEVAGVGGTSWARVESKRCPEGSTRREVGERLSGYGVPTPDSTVIARTFFKDRLVIASGGIRNGIDAAIAIALGADAVALAAPVLERVVESEEAAVHFLEALIEEMRILMFASGIRSIDELKNAVVIAINDDPILALHAPHLGGRLRRGW